MSQSGIYSTTGGSTTGAILSITGNTGGAVNPDGGGNISLLGQYGVQVNGNPIGDLLDISNTRNVSNYVVGIDGLSEFSVIQSAIIQAQIDGADQNQPATIWIQPGTYVEDITLVDWIYLAAACDNVFILGNCTYVGSGGKSSLYNLNLTSPDASPALALSGTATLNCKLGSFTAGTGAAISVSNTTLLTLTNVNLTSQVSGSYIFEMTGGVVQMFGGYVNSNDTPSALSNSSVLYITGVIYFGSGFALTTASTLTVLSSYLFSNVALIPVITIDGTSTCIANNSSFFCSDTGGFFIEGTGYFSYDNITVLSESTLLDPDLNLNGQTILPVITPTQSYQLDLGVSYIVAGAVQGLLTLPVLANIGAFITVIGFSPGGFRILQNVGQTIHLGADSSTTGILGYAFTPDTYSAMKLVCVDTNTHWVITEYTGAVGLV
tara:strand:- start:6447 stop:7751 length:1305 start_codon:yes stop_codon:yes gene_type:complete